MPFPTQSTTPSHTGPVDEDLPGFVVIGPDLAGNLLEVIVVAREHQEALAIYAMALRPKYRHLLP